MADNNDLPEGLQNGARANPSYIPLEPNDHKRQKTSNDQNVGQDSIHPEELDFGTTPETDVGKAFILEAATYTFIIKRNFDEERQLYELDSTEKKGAIKKIFDLDNKILKLKNSHLEKSMPSTLLDVKIPARPVPIFGGGNIIQFNCGGSEISIDSDEFRPDDSEIFGQLLCGPFKDCFMKEINGAIFLDLNPKFFQAYINENTDSALSAILHHQWHQPFDPFLGIPVDLRIRLYSIQ